jgi:hypothetical protein
MSTFGTLFKVTTYGESHGRTVGCIIDGVPPCLPLTEADIQPQLTRRRPGQSALNTGVVVCLKWELTVTRDPKQTRSLYSQELKTA